MAEVAADNFVAAIFNVAERSGLNTSLMKFKASKSLLNNLFAIPRNITGK